MEKRRRIVLFGNSIILGTIGASLRRSSRFEVITLPPSQPEDLKDMAPDIVLFDLEAERPEAAFSLSEGCSRVLFVGISPDTNLVKMWSGQQLRELSTLDLLEAIDQQLNRKEVVKREKQNR